MENYYRGKDVYVRFAFVYAGKQYQPGDPFIAPRHKIEQLWFARKLTHVGAQATTTVATLEHLGAGWYNVLLSGTVVNPEKIKSKQAAIEWAATNLGVTVE